MRAVLIIGAVVGRVVGFTAVAKAALILFAVFANMSGVVAFMANGVRGVGREVWSWDESGSYSGELAVPAGAVDSGDVVREDRDFYA